MAEKVLRLKISADITDLNTSLGQINAQVKSQVGNLLGAGRDIGIALSGIGVAITGGLGLALKAFGEAQRESISLTAALASTAGQVGLTRKELDELASSLSRVTTFDDDAISGAEALGLQFGNIGRDIFPQFIEAALNMSTALQQDVQTSILAVGRALNDPEHGLKAMKFMTADQKELAIELSKTGDAMGAQTAILNALGDAFGGRARAEALGLEGQFKQLAVESGNLAEVIGKSLTPMVTGFAGLVKPLIIDITDWAKAHPELTSNITLTAAAIGGLALALGPILIALPSLVSGFTLLTGAIGPLTPIILAVGAAFAGWKLGEWIGGLQVFGSTVGDIAFQMLGLQNIFGATTEVINANKEANDQLEFATEKLANSLKNKYGVEIKKGSMSVEQWNLQVKAAIAMHEAAAKSTDKVAESAKKHKQELDAANKAIEKTLDDQEALTRVNDESAKQWEELAKWTKENTDHLIDLSFVIKNNLMQQVPVLSGDIGELTDRTKENADAWETLGGKSSATLNQMKQDAYDAFQRIANSATSTTEDIKNAWDLLRGKLKDLTYPQMEKDANDSSKKVSGFWANQVSTIVTDFGRAVSDIIFKGGDFKQKMKDLFTSIGETIVRALIENGVKKIINALFGTGGDKTDSLSGALDQIGSKMSSVFDGIKTKIGSVVDSVIGGLGKLGGAIGNFFSGIGGLIGGTLGGAVGLGGSLGGGVGGKISGAAVGFLGTELLSNIVASVGAGTGLGTGVTTFLSALGPWGLAIAGAVLAIGPLIALLTKRGKQKIEDTKAVEPFWKNIWALQNKYAHEAPTGDPATEQLNRDAVLTVGVSGWNELVKSFKLKSSADSQRKYIFDWIKAINADFARRYTGYSGAPAASTTLPVTPLARGGIVRVPTLAMIGESGPEVVVPLRRGRGGRDQMGFGHTINQTINIGSVSNLTDQRRMLNRINRHLQRQLA